MYFAEVYVLRDKEDPQNWDVPVWSQKSYPHDSWHLWAEWEIHPEIPGEPRGAKQERVSLWLPTAPMPASTWDPERPFLPSQGSHTAGGQRRGHWRSHRVLAHGVILTGPGWPQQLQKPKWAWGGGNGKSLGAQRTSPCRSKYWHGDFSWWSSG